ncbi:hypothetical protein Q31b_34440 [Novipirellula aureliae]|uniref:Uncharacterized protein n=1 Tax=Novipirellula aureliae TaxID=2527966 RepID=A0A5C6DTU5_9BACT|nr:hypothetical protein [Novipirellula aureliae]TWU40100.1 hypothetical protein Q31b_34440 [Novipirellula aureliae]
MHAVVYREKTEPREGSQPIPIWLILASFSLLMWGGWYLGRFSADFAVDRYEGPNAYASSSALTTEKRITQIDPVLMGKRVYTNCAACH